MPKYHLLRGTFWALEDGSRVCYEPGDVIDISEERAEGMRGMVKKAEEPEFSTADLKDRIEESGGGWYTLPNGEKIRGEESAIQRLKELIDNGEL